MYTLRILSNDHVVTNHNLGESYTVSYPGSIPFKRELEAIDGERTPKDRINAVLHNAIGVTFFLTNDSEYFIMTDSGKTFERL
jgi:hypothetical protein